MESNPINQIRRWLIIDQLFRRAPYHYQVKDILKYFSESEGIEITRGTVYNDLRNMNELFSSKIYIEVHQNKYSYQNKNASILDYQVDEESKMHLEFVLYSLKQSLNKEAYEKTKKIFKEVFQLNKNADWQDHKLIRTEKQANNTRWLDKLYEAITKKQVVRVKYKKYGASAKDRLMSPYGLKEYMNNWYLIAFDHSSKGSNMEVKIFSLSNIYGLEILNDITFESSKNFSIQQYFKHSIGIYHYYKAKPQKVRLKITGEQSIEKILLNPIHASQTVISRKPTDLLIELYVYNSPELITEIFKYGKNIEIMGPNSLRREYREYLNEILLKY